MAELKYLESYTRSNSKWNLKKGKHIIDVKLSAIVSTNKVQQNEPEYVEEGEFLFHSQMWVKGVPLPFILNSES